MTVDKQRLMITYMLSSTDAFVITHPIIRSTYFDPLLRNSVEFILEYYQEYSALPTDAQLKAETGEKFDRMDHVTVDNLNYYKSEIQSFCRQKAIEQAIAASPALAKEGRYSEIEDNIRQALLTSIKSEVGLSYYKDPMNLLEEMLVEPDRTTTLFGDAFDDAIGGGLQDTEVILFTANSGGGKSIALQNLGKNFAQQGHDVLYATLELSEKMIFQRYNQMHTGIGSREWKDHYEEIAATIIKEGRKAGNLVITRMPLGTNANMIRAKLKEYELEHKKLPKLLIVDYLDLMGPNGKMSADNISLKDKVVTEELREIAVEYNIIIATASQQNRQGIDATEASQAHIAGGLTKINTVDIVVSITLNAQLKAQGRIWFQFTKTRSSDGAGKSVLSIWDNRTLRILPPSDKDRDLIEAMDALNNKTETKFVNKTFRPGVNNMQTEHETESNASGASKQTIDRLRDLKQQFKKPKE